MAKLGRYVVLKDKNTRLRHGRPFSPDLGAVTTGLADVPPEPGVECCEMAPREAQRLGHDPEVLAVARAMPTHLIEPRWE